jgi:hypothetical protein
MPKPNLFKLDNTSIKGDNTMNMSNKLADHSALTCKVAIYVPLMSEKYAGNDTEDTAIFLADMFGGATVIRADGIWKRNVKDTIDIVYSYCDSLNAESESAIITHCRKLALALKQDAIALEVNGSMYFI